MILKVCKINQEFFTYVKIHSINITVQKRLQLDGLANMWDSYLDADDQNEENLFPLCSISSPVKEQLFIFGYFSLSITPIMECMTEVWDRFIKSC